MVFETEGRFTGSRSAIGGCRRRTTLPASVLDSWRDISDVIGGGRLMGRDSPPMIDNAADRAVGTLGERTRKVGESVIRFHCLEFVAAELNG